MNLNAQIVNDLSNKCTSDTMDAIMRSVSLCDTGTEKFVVSINGVTSAGGIAACLLGKEELLEHSGEFLADATLYAMVFCWLCREPNATSYSVKSIATRAKTIWECATGRDFDSSWLKPEIAKHL